MYMVLTHDDIVRDIPYQLICETMEGCRWGSGKRRRMFCAEFNRSEQKKISELKKLAHDWYLVKGVPNSVRMSYKTYLLWGRLASFCLNL